MVSDIQPAAGSARAPARWAFHLHCCSTMNRLAPLLGHLRPGPASHLGETAEDRRLAPADGPTLRVGMIGAGRYANTWGRAYATSERCQIVAVCEYCCACRL